MPRLLQACLILVVIVAPLWSGEPDKKARTAMSQLNKSFLVAHAATRKHNLAAGGPIVLLHAGKMVLVRNSKEQATDIVPAEYDTFKVFAHMPVAIYLMLGPYGEGKLDGKRVELLRAYRKKMDSVGELIKDIGLKGADLARQKKMLAASKEFLDGVINNQQVSTKDLYKFTRSMTPMIKENLAGAAASQLDVMHRQMLAWKKEMTAKEWNTLRVVVQGAVLAREGNLAKQYFERLLNLKGEGVRMVYMESYYPPTPMETLLATRTVDRGISVAFFENPDRMFRDVLADAATAYIKKMKFD